MRTRDEYVKQIKGAFVSVGTKGLMGVIHVEAPITLNPILNFIIEHIVEKILTEVADLTELQIFFAYIDFRVGKQGIAFYEAAKAYQIAKTKSPEEKALAEKALIDRARELISLGN